MATARPADMFTADGKPSDDDPREHLARLGDERTTLVEALRGLRLTLELKCAGLDAEAMARRSVEPSTMSLLGLVRHLAEMERATFRLLSGQDVPGVIDQRSLPTSPAGGGGPRQLYDPRARVSAQACRTGTPAAVKVPTMRTCWPAWRR